MKKEIKVVISVFLAVWCFFMGFELGSYKEKKSAGANVNISVNNTTAAPVTTTETNTTQAPTAQPSITDETTTDPSSGETTDAGNSDVSETKANANNSDPSSMSKAEIADAIAKAMNQVKKEQNMTAHKTEKVTINLTKLSIAAAKDTVNNVIQKLAGEDDYTYTFTNGQGTGVDQDGKATDDGATVTPYQVIPPSNKDYSLPVEGIASAKAYKDGGNTVYEIKLVEEDTTYSSPMPQYHANAYGFLDLTSLNITGVSITDASMHYEGATIEVTVNGDGKVVKLHFFMPMDGYGAAKIAFFNGDASFEGSDDETWEFTY